MPTLPIRVHFISALCAARCLSTFMKSSSLINCEEDESNIGGSAKKKTRKFLTDNEKIANIQQYFWEFFIKESMKQITLQILIV